MRIQQSFTLLAAAILTVSAHASESTYGDWTLACNNTGRCEAIGFQVENGGQPVALRISRDAGPGTPVRGMFQLEIGDGAFPLDVALQVGTVTLGSVRLEEFVPEMQFNKMLAPMLSAEEMLLRADTRTWTLSLRGLKAVLLKMDEMQGRVGTPGALLPRGTKAERSVPPERPARTLHAEKPVPVAIHDPKLTAALMRATKGEECDVADPVDASVFRLSSAKLLFMRECNRGAYQSAYQLWTTNASPPYSPSKLMLPKGNESVNAELISPSFENGVLNAYAKFRGIGDCGETTRWVWTDSGFQMLTWERASQCRGFPGGAPLSLWFAKEAK